MAINIDDRLRDVGVERADRILTPLKLLVRNLHRLTRNGAAPAHPLNIRSMVSREPRVVRWFRRRILCRNPVLYHFEVHITDHCNLNCKGCSHFSNLCEPSFADLGEFEADMKRMAGLFSAVRQIYLLGGEPLLHLRVSEFARVARRIFPKTRIVLMTNGTLVTRQKEEFWSALREARVILLCDSYPIGLPVQEINRLGREQGVKIEWTVQRGKFFKVPLNPRGEHDAHSSFTRCHGRNNCPLLKNGRLYPCGYIAFADVFRKHFNIREFEPTHSDSISIDEPPELIMEFLLNPVPWCSHCDMDSLEFYTWGRSKRTMDEWIKTTLDLSSLVFLVLNQCFAEGL